MITVPPALQWVMDAVAGQSWPQANEDELRSVAEDWTSTAGALDGIAGDINTIATQLQLGLSGSIGDQATEYLNQLGSAPGQIAPAVAGLADSHDQMALQTETTKLMILAQFIWTAIEVSDLLSSVWGALAVPEVMAITRLTVWQLMKKFLETIPGMVIKAAVHGALLQGLMDLSVQLTEWAAGDRTGIDWSELATSVEMGAAGGAIGGVLHIGAAKLLPKGALDTLPGKFAIGAVNGFLTGEATAFTFGGGQDPLELLESSIIGGAFGAFKKSEEGASPEAGDLTAEEAAKISDIAGELDAGAGKLADIADHTESPAREVTTVSGPSTADTTRTGYETTHSTDPHAVPASGMRPLADFLKDRQPDTAEPQWFVRHGPLDDSTWKNGAPPPVRRVTTESYDVAYADPVNRRGVRPVTGLIAYDLREYDAPGGLVRDFTVKLRLKPAEGSSVTSADLTEVQRVAKNSVEKFLNKPGYGMPDGARFHVTLEFTSDPEDLVPPHAEITVGPRATDGEHPDDAGHSGHSGAHNDQLAWTAGAEGEVLVHEILHYLGAPDEARDPSRVLYNRPAVEHSAVFDDDGIMGVPRPEGKLLPRNIQKIFDVMRSEVPDTKALGLPSEVHDIRDTRYWRRREIPGTYGNTMPTRPAAAPSYLLRDKALGEHQVVGVPTASEVDHAAAGLAGHLTALLGDPATRESLGAADGPFSGLTDAQITRLISHIRDQVTKLPGRPDPPDGAQRSRPTPAQARAWAGLLRAGVFSVHDGHVVHIRPIPVRLEHLGATEQNDYLVTFSGTTKQSQTVRDSAKTGMSLFSGIFNSVSASLGGLAPGAPKISGGLSSSVLRGTESTAGGGTKIIASGREEFAAGLGVQISIDGKDLPNQYGHEGQARPLQLRLPRQNTKDAPQISLPTRRFGTVRDNRASGAQVALVAADLGPALRGTVRALLDRGVPPRAAAEVMKAVSEQLLNETVARDNSRAWFTTGHATKPIEVTEGARAVFRGTVELTAHVTGLELVDATADTDFRADQGFGVSFGFGRRWTSETRANLSADAGNIVAPGLAGKANASIGLFGASRRGHGSRYSDLYFSKTTLMTHGGQFHYDSTLRLDVAVRSSTHRVEPFSVDVPAELEVPKVDAAGFETKLLGSVRSPDVLLFEEERGRPLAGSQDVPLEPLPLALRRGTGFGRSVNLTGSERVLEQVRANLHRRIAVSILTERARLTGGPVENPTARRVDELLAGTDLSELDAELTAKFGTVTMEGDLSNVLSTIDYSGKAAGSAFDVSVTGVLLDRDGSLDNTIDQTVNHRILDGSTDLATGSTTAGVGVFADAELRFKVDGLVDVQAVGVEVEGSRMSRSEQGQSLNVRSYRRTETDGQADHGVYPMAYRIEVRQDGREPEVWHLEGNDEFEVSARISVPRQHRGRELPGRHPQTQTVVARPEDLEAIRGRGTDGLKPAFMVTPELEREISRAYYLLNHGVHDSALDEARIRQLSGEFDLRKRWDWPETIRAQAKPSALDAMFGAATSVRGAHRGLPEEHGYKQSMNVKIGLYNPRLLSTHIEGEDGAVEIEQYSAVTADTAKLGTVTYAVTGDAGAGVIVKPGNTSAGDGSGTSADSAGNSRAAAPNQIAVTGSAGGGREWSETSQTQAGQISVSRATYGGISHTYQADAYFEVTLSRRWGRKSQRLTVRLRADRAVEFLATNERARLLGLPDADHHGTAPVRDDTLRPVDHRLALMMSHPEDLTTGGADLAIADALEKHGVLKPLGPEVGGRPNDLRLWIDRHFSDLRLKRQYPQLRHTGLVRYHPVLHNGVITKLVRVRVTADIGALRHASHRAGNKLMLRGEKYTGSGRSRGVASSVQVKGNVSGHGTKDTALPGGAIGGSRSWSWRRGSGTGKTSKEIYRLNSQGDSELFDTDLSLKVEVGVLTELPEVLRVPVTGIKQGMHALSNLLGQQGRGIEEFWYSHRPGAVESVTLDPIDGKASLLVPSNLTRRGEHYPAHDPGESLGANVYTTPRPAPLAVTGGALDLLREKVHPLGVPAADAAARWAALSTLDPRMRPRDLGAQGAWKVGRMGANTNKGSGILNQLSDEQLTANLPALLAADPAERYKIKIGGEEVSVGFEITGVERQAIAPYKVRRYTQDSTNPTAVTGNGRGFALDGEFTTTGEVEGGSRALEGGPGAGLSGDAGHEEELGSSDTVETDEERRGAYRHYRLSGTLVLTSKHGAVHIDVENGAYLMLSEYDARTFEKSIRPGGLRLSDAEKSRLSEATRAGLLKGRQKLAEFHGDKTTRAQNQRAESSHREAQLHESRETRRADASARAKRARANLQASKDRLHQEKIGRAQDRREESRPARQLARERHPEPAPWRVRPAPHHEELPVIDLSTHRPLDTQLEPARPFVLHVSQDRSTVVGRSEVPWRSGPGQRIFVLTAHSVDGGRLRLDDDGPALSYEDFAAQVRQSPGFASLDDSTEFVFASCKAAVPGPDGLSPAQHIARALGVRVWATTGHIGAIGHPDAGFILTPDDHGNPAQWSRFSPGPGDHPETFHRELAEPTRADLAFNVSQVRYMAKGSGSGEWPQDEVPRDGYCILSSMIVSDPIAVRDFLDSHPTVPADLAYRRLRAWLSDPDAVRRDIVGRGHAPRALEGARDLLIKALYDYVWNLPDDSSLLGSVVTPFGGAADPPIRRMHLGHQVLDWGNAWSGPNGDLFLPLAGQALQREVRIHNYAHVFGSADPPQYTERVTGQSGASSIHLVRSNLHGPDHYNPVAPAAPAPQPDSSPTPMDVEPPAGGERRPLAVSIQVAPLNDKVDLLKAFADQAWVHEIGLDKDRPMTKFGSEGQKSHTVAWELVRRAMMSRSGRTVRELFKSLEAEREAFLASPPKQDPKDIAWQRWVDAKARLHDTLSELDHPHSVHEWQRLVSEHVSAHVELSQLTEFATHNGKVGGRGEPQALAKIARFEAGFEWDPPDVGEVAKLLDINPQAMRGDKLANLARAHLLSSLHHAYPRYMKSVRHGAPGNETQAELLTARIFGSGGLPKDVKVHELEPSEQLSAPAEGPVARRQIDSFVADVSLGPGGTVRRIALGGSSNSRIETKFKGKQGSHTASWSLQRESIFTFEGHSAGELRSWLEKWHELIHAAPHPDADETGIDDELDEAFGAVRNELDAGVPTYREQALLSEMIRLTLAMHQRAPHAAFSDNLQHGKAEGSGEKDLVQKASGKHAPTAEDSGEGAPTAEEGGEDAPTAAGTWADRLASHFDGAAPYSDMTDDELELALKSWRLMAQRFGPVDDATIRALAKRAYTKKILRELKSAAPNPQSHLIPSSTARYLNGFAKWHRVLSKFAADLEKENPEIPYQKAVKDSWAVAKYDLSPFLTDQNLDIPPPLEPGLTQLEHEGSVSNRLVQVMEPSSDLASKEMQDTVQSLVKDFMGPNPRKRHSPAGKPDKNSYPKQPPKKKWK